jgi:hypothetical protein
VPKAKKGKKHTAVRELFVQMKINRSNADAGDSGASVDASAVISVSWSPWTVNRSQTWARVRGTKPASRHCRQAGHCVMD